MGNYVGRWSEEKEILSPAYRHVRCTHKICFYLSGPMGRYQVLGPKTRHPAQHTLFNRYISGSERKNERICIGGVERDLSYA
jgi:hypothetical protein